MSDKTHVVRPHNGTLLSHNKEGSSDRLQHGWTPRTLCWVQQQSQKDRLCMTAFLPGTQSREIQRQEVDQRLAEAGGGERGQCLMCAVSVWVMTKFWKQWWQLHNFLNISNATELHTYQSGNFMLYIIHHSLKRLWHNIPKNSELHVEWVNCMVCELHLNKAVKKKSIQMLPLAPDTPDCHSRLQQRLYF